MSGFVEPNGIWTYDV